MAGAAAEEVSRIPAVLRSLTSFRVTGCVVETWTERASSGKAYTRCRIVNEPSDLPDGGYRVEFAGRSIRTNKVEGHWELTFLAPDVTIHRAA